MVVGALVGRSLAAAFCVPAALSLWPANAFLPAPGHPRKQLYGAGARSLALTARANVPGTPACGSSGQDPITCSTCQPTKGLQPLSPSSGTRRKGAAPTATPATMVAPNWPDSLWLHTSRRQSARAPQRASKLLDMARDQPSAWSSPSRTQCLNRPHLVNLAHGLPQGYHAVR